MTYESMISSLIQFEINNQESESPEPPSPDALLSPVMSSLDKYNFFNFHNCIGISSTQEIFVTNEAKIFNKLSLYGGKIMKRHIWKRRIADFQQKDLSYVKPRRLEIPVEVNKVFSLMGVGKLLGVNWLNVRARDYGYPAMTIAGFSRIGDTTGLPLLRHANSYEVAEGLSLVRGRHSLSLGGEVRHYRLNSLLDMLVRLMPLPVSRRR
jgi:hypothetical protein